MHFPPFVIDRVNGELLRDGKAVPLTRKAFQVLDLLAGNAGTLVTKQRLIETVWAGTHVHESVLKVCILEIRKALGETGHQSRYIETLRGRGYRFVVPVSVPVATAGETTGAFFERDHEMSALAQLFEKASSTAARQLVLVSGEPGIGKTTLIERFLSQITERSQEPVILHANCVEHFGADEPYYPVLAALTRAARNDTDTTRQILRQFAPTWLVQLPSLLQTGEVEAIRNEIFGATTERMLREMTEALEHWSGRSPLILVLEDLHWSDHATVNLLSWLAHRSDPARLLIVGTYRPMELQLREHPFRALRQDLLGRRLGTELTPGNLSSSGVSALIESRLPGHQLPPEFVEVLLSHTGGNPFFISQVIEYAASRGLIVERSGSWQLDVPLSALDLGVPETLMLTVARQIECLPPDQTQILEAASVVGQEFPITLLSDELDRERVDMICEELAGKRLFIERLSDGCHGTTQYRFSHAVHREAFYRNIGEGRRRTLHEQIAIRLERVCLAGTEEVASELAAHFGTARLFDRAIPHLLVAAGRASARHAHPEALTILRRGINFSEQLPPSAESIKFELLFRMKVVEGCRAMGSLGAAATELRELIERARTYRDAMAELNSLSALVSVLSFHDREGCLEVLPVAERLADEIGDSSLIAIIRGEAAYFRVLFEGWSGEYAQLSSAALTAARERGDPSRVSLHCARHAWVQCLQSDYAAASATAQESLAASIRADRFVDYSIARFYLCWALLHNADWSRMEATCSRAIERAQRNGHRVWVMLFQVLDAWRLLHLGSFQYARRIAEGAVGTALELSHPLGEQMARIVLGSALVGLSDLAEAEKHLRIARQNFHSRRVLMDWFWSMPMQLAFVNLLLARGNTPAAEREASQFVQNAFATEEKTWQALALHSLARALLAAGKQSAAESPSSRAQDLIDRHDLPLAEFHLKHLTRSAATPD